MKVTKQEMERVAVLSRLSIPADEAKAYTEQLSAFLEYVENLQKVDTEKVKPTTYALPIENVFRTDEVRPSLPREAALSNAPLQENGYFKVPRVLEE